MKSPYPLLALGTLALSLISKPAHALSLTGAMSAPANANSSSAAAMPGSLTNTKQAPFETTAALYKNAKPMPLRWLPSASHPNLKSWHCANTWQGITREQFEATVQDVMSVAVAAKVVVKPGVPEKPAIPSAGPAFPAIPAVPAIPPVYKDIMAVLAIPTDGSFNETPEEIGDDWTEAEAKLVSTSPGLVGTFESEAGTPESTETETFRLAGGALIVRATFPASSDWHFNDTDGDDAGKVQYTYCWQDKN